MTFNEIAVAFGNITRNCITNAHGRMVKKLSKNNNFKNELDELCRNLT
jgi:hypothetical protein